MIGIKPGSFSFSEIFVDNLPGNRKIRLFLKTAIRKGGYRSTKRNRNDGIV